MVDVQMDKTEEDKLINDYFLKYKCDFADRRNLAIVRGMTLSHLIWMIENVVNAVAEKRIEFYEALFARYPNKAYYVPGSSKFFQGFFHIDGSCLPPIRREAHSWRIDPMVYMSFKSLELNTLIEKVALPCSSCFYDFLNQYIENEA
jgi:hypothetical protein